MHRKYTPHTGSFNAPDPLWTLSVDASSYHYGRHDPVNTVDPWGLDPVNPPGNGSDGVTSGGNSGEPEEAPPAGIPYRIWGGQVYLLPMIFTADEIRWLGGHYQLEQQGKAINAATALDKNANPHLYKLNTDSKLQVHSITPSSHSHNLVTMPTVIVEATRLPSYYEFSSIFIPSFANGFPDIDVLINRGASITGTYTLSVIRTPSGTHDEIVVAGTIHTALAKQLSYADTRVDVKMSDGSATSLQLTIPSGPIFKPADERISSLGTTSFYVPRGTPFIISSESSVIFYDSGNRALFYRFDPRYVKGY